MEQQFQANNNTYAVKGRDLRSGTPKEVNITEEDTAEALNDILKEMVNGIKDALRKYTTRIIS